MSSPAGLLEEVRALADEHAERLKDHWDEQTRPHAARMLIESATVAVRAGAGEDVSVAQIALDASIKNLGRTQQSIVQLEGRQLALRAALSLLTKI